MTEEPKVVLGSELGPTGKFPDGKLNKNDHGELAFGIRKTQDGLIEMYFTTPITWLAMPPHQAIELAKILLRTAGASQVSITL